MRDVLDARWKAISAGKVVDLNRTVLTADRGGPWRKRHFSRRFNEACAEAGITGLTFHDARGTAITMLTEAGCSEGLIASITGHAVASVSQILKRYRANTIGPAREAMAKLRNYMATDFANRLQTVASVQGSDPSEGR